jgi:Leucine-rich repeat (LRR) protein
MAQNRDTGNVLLFGLSSFTINLTSNTLLQTLDLSNNRINTFTNTIISCTSLINLNLSFNALTTIPPLPNSIQNLILEANTISSLPPTLPTSLIYFNANSLPGVGGGFNIFPTWSQILTTSPNLQTFLLNGVSLSSWTQNFPSNVKLVSLISNNLTTFNMNYFSTASNFTLDLSSNFITTITNFSSSIQVADLNISTNQINNQYNILPLGNTFPTSLTALTMSINPIVNWSISFASATSLRRVIAGNCSLNQSSVDFILCNLANNTTLTNGTLVLSNTVGTPNPNSSPSPAGIACRTTLTSAGRNWSVSP